MYLTLLPQRIACYLTAYFDEKSPFERVVHLEVFNVHKKSPRLNTPYPNARSEKRKIPVQNDRAATNPTPNPSTYTLELKLKLKLQYVCLDSALDLWPPGHFELGFFASRIRRSEMECSALSFSYVGIFF